ncbi:MAG: glucuronate isomerase [Pirellulaceae bacterium]
MSQSTRDSIYEAIASIRLVDPHTHINPHNPGSQTLADILGYHYYTELVHSAGMPKSRIEEDGISPRELVGRLVEGLPNIENTANYQWLINICKTFFDFQDDRITTLNWESLFDTAEERMSSAQWPQMVLDKSNVEAVFLTNDFDDDLEGFDTNTYIPCLRTDDLVFHLGKSQTRERLAGCSGIELDGSLESLRASLRQRFEHFVPNGARACAISIPPDFSPERVADGRAETALDAVLTKGVDADVSHHVALSRRVFWTLAELCDEFQLPFDLMIGVNRGVYPGGVYQGQDLYDSRVSLTQYRELFNAFPDVKFPISVLASVTNQELVSHAWIFPNVITNGHWWYSNTPSFIARDAAARLEAVPRNKQIGYYSDAYKLEFVWPKFDMYRNILADILSDYFVGDCGWDEERAIELGHQVLRGNVDTIFPNRFADDVVDEVEEVVARHVEVIPEVIPDAIDVAEAEADDLMDDELLEEVSSDDEPSSEEVSYVAYDEVDDAEADADDLMDEELLGDDDEPVQDEPSDHLGVAGMAAGASAALAAGAIGMVEVSDAGEVSGVQEVFEQPEPQQPVTQEFMSDLYETVEEVDEIADEAVGEFDVVEEDEDEVAVLDLDPNPSDDEVQAAEVEDVVFDDRSESVVDVETIESEADVEPLNVGDLLGDEADGVDDVAAYEEDVEESTLSPDVHPLRGEESFTLDEDSLQLVKDPITGEMTFAQPKSEPAEENPVSVEQRELDFVDDDDFGAGIEATIELDGPYEEAQEAADDVSDDLTDDSGEIDLTEFDDEEKQ